jgi:hypothetical protein
MLNISYNNAIFTLHRSVLFCNGKRLLLTLSVKELAGLLYASPVLSLLIQFVEFHQWKSYVSYM